MDEEAIGEALDSERADATARLAAAQAEFDEIVSGSMDVNGDDEHDPEGATVAFERSRVAAVAARSQARIDEIDRARARLEAGAYGRCEQCGADIGADRLSARPTTTVCIRCASGSAGPSR